MSTRRMQLHLEIVKARKAGESFRTTIHRLKIGRSYYYDCLHDPHGIEVAQRHKKARRTCPKCGELMSWPSRKSDVPTACKKCLSLGPEVYEVLYAEGNSTHDIAEMLNVTPQTVWHGLNSRGVKLRPKSEACRIAWARKKEAA